MQNRGSYSSESHSSERPYYLNDPSNVNKMSQRRLNHLQNNIDSIFDQAEMNASQRRNDIYLQSQKARDSAIRLKVVGNTGSSYRVVEPDVEEFFARRDKNRLSQKEKFNNNNNNSLHYKLGDPISMNSKQRAQQSRGELKGCISNCDILPVGQGNKIGNSVEYPDPNPILYGLYQNSTNKSSLLNMKSTSDI